MDDDLFPELFNLNSEVPETVYGGETVGSSQKIFHGRRSLRDYRFREMAIAVYRMIKRQGPDAKIAYHAEWWRLMPFQSFADVLAGENLPHVDYEEVRGMEHTREAELEIAGKKIKIAVVHTLKSAMEMLYQEQPKSMAVHA